MTKKLTFDSEISSKMATCRDPYRSLYSFVSTIHYQGSDNANHYVVINKLVSTNGLLQEFYVSYSYYVNYLLFSIWSGIVGLDAYLLIFLCVFL
jgi:hypothetical protein